MPFEKLCIILRQEILLNINFDDMILETGIQELQNTVKSLPRDEKRVACTGYARVVRQDSNMPKLTPRVLIGGIREA